jgi:drug/metabolite transporter (DMT)-like permease
LKEHTTKWQKISTILSVAGVIYIFVMKDLNVELANLKGAILILLSALSSAGYNVLARKMTKHYQVFDLTLMMTIIGCVVFNVMSIIAHITNHTLSLYFSPFTNGEFLVSILYLGILSSLCTSFLSNYALSKIEASKMSVFSNLATLITMIAGVIFLHEKMQYFHIIGAVIIVIGVIGTNFSGNIKNMSPSKVKNNAG